MLEVVLHDRAVWRQHLLPLLHTRSAAELRVGILTIAEKWRKFWNVKVSYHTAEHLQGKYAARPEEGSFLVVRANLCPSEELLMVLASLPMNTVLESKGRWLAYRTSQWVEEPNADDFIALEYEGHPVLIEFLEDIYLKNEQQICADFDLLTKNVASEMLEPSNTLIGEALFLGKSVEAFCCVFNTVKGPIYIGEGAVIEESSVLKGPLVIGAYSRVKAGAKLYPNVTIGPRCTVGGEVNNAVFLGNSSKGHEGYLGCAVLGEWCNIGAGCSNSNLQNNWASVKLYDYKLADYRNTDLLKIGTFIGDFAMIGINSSITTGAVIGVGAQIAISNIIPKFVPDFVWLTDGKKSSYIWDNFAEMMQRRIDRISERDGIEVDVLASVYEQTRKKREIFIKV
ncbi:putative sugar nucleotidyl transferase [Sphingobacterium sp. UT-1RO-CII-1]|uniref:putative sugar nucleotidyl transferase n=1 Tax=Sphingobacterium sp. UT-1RO-CII-1 TaxID=2995225 RepID=UPI00227AA26A|nr:putative sugar nucleotidyl transferase [Sphingobacterium sp. UT-1RO-CII-1]MCY4779441.1 putative sugar nucleotidyl transferase [Sphingobacterium sp. UT-1RO-CII-1]